MSSSCLSSGGGGRAYRIEALDLDVIKSPSSTTSWISNSSSPSSTLSESSNCPLAITTRKPRTPRKRPNQTYNEAAAILSTAYPKVFPVSHDRTTNYATGAYMFESSELLIMPFREADALLDTRLLLEKPVDAMKGANLCRSPPEIDSSEDLDFDAESILDEEMGEGIDSIMGNVEIDNGGFREPSPQPPISNNNNSTFAYGYPVGLGLGMGVGMGMGFGMRRESRAAMRSGGDNCDWWRFPCVNVVDVNPNMCKNWNESKKKKVEVCEEAEEEECAPQGGLLLKLNYDGILHAWSDKASPFSGESPASSDAAGNNLRARLAQIELFWDNGGVREASVLRYKEKRRSRLFSKKIRYQVRKLNADRRPRMKGRFVRTPTSSHH